jgi:hypothetical protein
MMPMEVDLNPDPNPLNPVDPVVLAKAAIAT